MGKKAKRKPTTSKPPARILKYKLTPDELAQLKKDQADLNRARKTIDRALAIRDGLIPPPWTEKLVEKLLNVASAEPETRPTANRNTEQAVPNSEKKRKSYWDDAVDRVLKEKYPHNDAKNFKPKDVVEVVLDALTSEIKQSGRQPPGRGLILRRSGHWKS